MSTKEYTRLLLSVQDAAEEQAKKDLAFALAGADSKPSNEIQSALLFYARSGAARALSHLNLHNHLKEAQ